MDFLKDRFLSTQSNSTSKGIAGGNQKQASNSTYHHIDNIEKYLRCSQFGLSIVAFITYLVEAAQLSSSATYFSIVIILISALFSFLFGIVTFELKHSFFVTLGRLLREVRLSIAINVTETLFLLLVSIITAANSKTGLQKFGTAICWFLFIIWSTSLFFIVRQMIEIRKMTVSNPFAENGLEAQDFQHEEDEEVQLNHRRQSGPFADRDRYQHTDTDDYQDPFEEAVELERYEGRENRMRELDPYEQVRKSMSLAPLSSPHRDGH